MTEEQKKQIAPARTDIIAVYRELQSRRWHAEDLQPLCAKLGEGQTGKTLVAVAALEQVGLITAAEKALARFTTIRRASSRFSAGYLASISGLNSYPYCDNFIVGKLNLTLRFPRPAQSESGLAPAPAGYVSLSQKTQNNQGIYVGKTILFHSPLNFFRKSSNCHAASTSCVPLRVRRSEVR